MSMLPRSEIAWFVRTDFSDDAAWQAICAEIRELPPEDKAGFAEFAELNAAIGQSMHVEDFQAEVLLVDSREYAGLTVGQLLECVPKDSGQTFLFIVDAKTVSHADHPILVVDLYDQPGRTFRTLPTHIQKIENNLSLANMDWEDFADEVAEDGIFRGFKA